MSPIPFWGMAAGTATVIATDLRPRVWLQYALNSGYLERVDLADQVILYHGYAVWPCYEFDDIDVAAAQDPANKYDVAVQVDGVPAHSVIGHTAPTRAPTSCGATCEPRHEMDAHTRRRTMQKILMFMKELHRPVRRQRK